MGLETAPVTAIEDLDETWPLGTDPKSQGDDHLRNIKSALKTQFPNLGPDPYTGTVADLESGGTALQDFNGRTDPSVVPTEGDYDLPMLGDVNDAIDPTTDDGKVLGASGGEWTAVDVTEARGYFHYSVGEAASGGDVVNWTTADYEDLGGLITITQSGTSGLVIEAVEPVLIVLNAYGDNSGGGLWAWAVNQSIALAPVAIAPEDKLGQDYGDLAGSSASGWLDTGDQLRLHISNSSLQNLSAWLLSGMVIPATGTIGGGGGGSGTGQVISAAQKSLITRTNDGAWVNTDIVLTFTQTGYYELEGVFDGYGDDGGVGGENGKWDLVTTGTMTGALIVQEYKGWQPDGTADEGRTAGGGANKDWEQGFIDNGTVEAKDGTQIYFFHDYEGTANALTRHNVKGRLKVSATGTITVRYAQVAADTDSCYFLESNYLKATRVDSL